VALIYFLGQDVGLSTTVVDGTGAPVPGTLTVALAVTDPSGVTSSPAASSAGGGRYVAVVPSVAAAGVWTYRWAAAAVGFVDEGQFQVRPMGVEQVVDLASVKAHLNITTDNLARDAELQGFILAAGDLARDVVGPLLPEQHTQWFDGGRSSIVPDWLPLASVQSVTEFYGLSQFPLTEQPLGAQSTAFSFTVDYDTGQITRRTFGGEPARFAAGAKNIKVVYTAGRGGAIPWTVRLGALELIRHLWSLTQQGGLQRVGQPMADVESGRVPTGFALPQRVRELWQPYKRPPGIA
jgi:hypothetical protein